jgi:hypothetical protein
LLGCATCTIASTAAGITIGANGKYAVTQGSNCNTASTTACYMTATFFISVTTSSGSSTVTVTPAVASDTASSATTLWTYGAVVQVF